MNLVFLNTWGTKDKLDFIKHYQVLDRHLMAKIYKMSLKNISTIYSYLIDTVEFPQVNEHDNYVPEVKKEPIVIHETVKKLREENAWLKLIPNELRMEMIDHYRIHTIEQFKQVYYWRLGFKTPDVSNSKVLLRLNIVCRSIDKTFPKFKGCKDKKVIAFNMINTGEDFTCKRFHITKEELHEILKEVVGDIKNEQTITG